jgi:2-iminobutanoate/2-iminopropanoate deaminase
MNLESLNRRSAEAGNLPDMTREVISTADAPPAIGPYSQGIRAEGRFVFFSGQIPLTPSGELVQGDIKIQTEQVLKNIDGLLKAAGLTPQNVVKTSVFLSSMDLFAPMNEVYSTFFKDNPPARSTVAAAGLPRGVDIEIEVMAVY